MVVSNNNPIPGSTLQVHSGPLFQTYVKRTNFCTCFNVILDCRHHVSACNHLYPLCELGCDLWPQNLEEKSGSGTKVHWRLDFSKVIRNCHMVRHSRCVFVNYNWINQLSNTTIWCLDTCCLLHRCQLHVSALMAIFRLIEWQQTCKQLYFGMRLVYGGGGLGLDGGTRSRVCWVGRVMWVHGYYCAGLSLYSLHLWFWI